MPASCLIRIILPYHLRNLARVGDEVTLEIPSPATVGAVLDALEARYPTLRGTVRDHSTLQRRPFIRFFANQQDLSHDPPDTPLPADVASGQEPFLVIGAIAGGAACNVIAPECNMKGTVRYYRPETARMLHENVRRAAEKTTNGD